MTDKQAIDLTAAISYVDNIPAKSNVMVKMRDIHNVIPSKAIFEQVRDDIKDGVLVREEIGELGFVFPHTGQRTFNAYAVIAVKRSEVGSIDALTIEALAAKVRDAMIMALRTN